jgi:hypothetical protein
MNRVDLEETHAPDCLQHVAFTGCAQGAAAESLRGNHYGLSFGVR